MTQSSLNIVLNGKAYTSLDAALSSVKRGIIQSPKESTKIIKRELKKFLNDIALELKNLHSKSYSPGKNTSKQLQVRSGKSIESIFSSINVKGSNLESLVGEMGGIKSLRIHEFGGDITPKSKKFLTVPLPAALDASGIPIHRSARDWEKTTVIKSKKGNILIVQTDGRDITPLYLLTKRVHIDARLRMRATVSKRLPDFADTLSSAILQELSRGLNNA